MIKNITHLELDLKKFPFEVGAFIGKQLFKKWTFTNEAEAKEALNGIWNEILKEKKK